MAATTNLGFWHVGECVINSRLEQVDLCQYHLVVKLLQLAQEGSDESEGIFVISVVDETGRRREGRRGLSAPNPDQAQSISRAVTHRAIRRVSKFCLRKMRFSDFAHSMYSLVTSICSLLLPGIAEK